MLKDLRLVTGPATPPVSLEEAKLHLRVDTADDDTLIEGLIDAAVAHLDGYSGVLGRAMIAQTWELSLDHFPGRHAALGGFLTGLSAGRRHGRHHHPARIHLPLPPLIAVASIAYVDPQGATQTLDPSQYAVLEGPVAAIDPVWGVTWPATRHQARAVTITFSCGYGAASTDVPKSLIVAIKMLVGHFYANGEAVVGIDQRGTPMPTPLGVDRLITPFRVQSRD